MAWHKAMKVCPVKQARVESSPTHPAQSQLEPRPGREMKESRGRYFNERILSWRDPSPAASSLRGRSSPEIMMQLLTIFLAVTLLYLLHSLANSRRQQPSVSTKVEHCAVRLICLTWDKSDD